MRFYEWSHLLLAVSLAATTTAGEPVGIRVPDAPPIPSPMPPPAPQPIPGAPLKLTPDVLFIGVIYERGDA